MQRLKTRAQYEAAMAGGTVSRTAHFVLHRAPLVPRSDSTGPGSEGSKALFAVQDEPWMGAVVPKRWAKRAVTRNGIKRQIYAVSADFATRLPSAAHVVRLKLDFARAQFPSAWSDALKAAVRGELQQLFAKVATSAIPAQAGIQGTGDVIPAKAGIQEGDR
ncbi:MAG TPA: ribonuclease P protein component [Ramlibacter sp.]|nr:ribonuclease P protein component [Ramlibacter sp.]